MLRLIALWVLLLWGGWAMADVTITEGVNDDPSPAGVGVKPYEMAGREEEREPLVTFEDCTQWLVESAGAGARLYRTAEQRLYRPHCGKLTYTAEAEESEIFVRLKEPVAIPEPWDCVNFWNFGAHWLWGEPHYRRSFRVAAVLEGADGESYEISFDQAGNAGLIYKYWFLSHAIVLESIPRPAKFVGFRFRGKKVTDEGEWLTLYFGPVYFYKEQLQPLKFEPWPEKLPFPTRAETILPTNKAADFENTVRKSGEAFLFEYRGSDCNLTYRVEPEAGGLDGISVRGDGKRISPCKGGGLGIAGDAQWRLLEARLADDTLTARWDVEADGVNKEFVFRYRIAQKSLIIDMEEVGEAPGIVEEVVLGRAEPVSEPKLFRIPFLNFDYTRGPSLLYADGLFFFTQFDWYVSDASRLSEGRQRSRDDWAQFNGGAVYTPKTNGERNPMRERLFINVSPDVHEVFPTIPNPPSPMREVQCDRLWSVRGGNDYEALYTEAKGLRDKGMEKVTIRYHEGFWRDGGESYTFRLNAAPEHGGDEAVRRHVARVQALGWRVGLYTNYTDFAPVNANWNEDWVMRGPRGEWMVSWSRCYAPKPMIAVEQEAKNAPQIQAKFGTNHSYCDVHTAVSPFSRVDYDWRVPGAATFRRTFECFGRLLYNEKFAYKGPVYSEGANHWWYAGLTDGNYGNAVPPVDKQPLFVDFQLLKIHPLQMDVGQSNVALTLAYGHIGMLRNMKHYYMLQPLQKYYSMVPVRRIAYESDGKLLDTSQALITDAYKNGRLYLEYESGLRVWVNAGEELWPIEAADREWKLTPMGHLAITEDGKTYSYSGLAPATDGSGEVPIDVCHGPVSHYLDTKGAHVTTEQFSGCAAVALKREEGGWEVIPDGAFEELSFSPSLIGYAEDADIALESLDAHGPASAKMTCSLSGGKIHIGVSGEGVPPKHRIGEATS